MRILATCILTLLLPTLGFTATKLERIENASELFVANVAGFLTREVPDISAVLPATDWDNAWRDSAACILDGMAQEKGNLWVGRYIRTAEEFASEPVTNAKSVRDAPAILHDPVAAEFAVTCGLFALALERAAQSGLVEAITTTDLGAKIDALP
jgi:hypothetical protein